MNKTHWFLRQCVLLVFMIQLVPWREAFPQSTGQAGLIEGAKKEGKVVWYAAMNINDSNALLSRFEKKYPFIKTELLRAGAEQLLNRILTEDSAGRSALDLVNLTTINALKRRGLLQLHHSQEFQAYPQEFKDTDGYWATLYNNYYVIGYNSIMDRKKMHREIGMIFSIPSGKGKLAWIKKNTSGMRRRSIIGVTKRRKNFIALWPNKRFIGTEAIQ